MRLKLQYVDNMAVLVVRSYSHLNSSNTMFKHQKDEKKRNQNYTRSCFIWRTIPKGH